jgi:predicted amidohydrolase
MRGFRVAAAASRSAAASPAENLARMPHWLAQARDEAAALVCFPELSITGYTTDTEIWEAAEPVPGPSTARLEELAAEFGVTIAAGIAEMDYGIVYNTYVFVSPDGYVGKSRKMHVSPLETPYWRGGGAPPALDLDVARVGVNICFDNWLPESARLVGLAGAEVIFAPFVWPVGDWGEASDHRAGNRAWKDYAQRCFPARAIDNGVFFVAVNAVGPVAAVAGGPPELFSNPIVLVYDPFGRLVAESPDDASDELMVVADLDREVLVERRSGELFHPRFRRPEIYASLSEGDIGAQSPR